MLKPIPLGLVTVATAGTPVPVTAALITAAGGGLPPSGGVCRIEVSPVSTNTGILIVKLKGSIVKDLLKPASGQTVDWCLKAEGNNLNPLDLSLDVATNGDGAYVTLWVE